MADHKAKVLLLDEATGENRGECDIITEATAVLYTNDTPTYKEIGRIPLGSTFKDTPVSDILTSMLYDKKSPSVISMQCYNGDIGEITDKVEINKPIGSQVDDFTLSVKFNFGSETKITINLYRYSGSHSKVYTVIKSKNDNDIDTVDFTVEGFDKDTTFMAEVFGSEVKDKYSSPISLSYKFISPIYVGWIRPDIINSIGELDKETTEDYFQELIDHNFNTLQCRFAAKSNQAAYVIPNINYSTRQVLNPCILIPQTWGELTKIEDINGNNITNSYAMCMEVDINTHGVYIEHYIAYVSRQSFADDNYLVGGIRYITDDIPNAVNISNFPGNAIPLMVGYSVQYGVPLDERFYRKTYKELLTMLYPYPGLQTYVEDINTTFRFEKGHWAPVSTKTHVVESIDELTPELGGWDDLAINAMDGKIWKKRYNNQWERYGDIKAEDGQVSLSLVKEDNSNNENNI